MEEVKPFLYQFLYHFCLFFSQVEEEEESACFLAWSTYSDLRQKDFDVDLELGARSQKLVSPVRSGTKKHSATNAGTTCPLILNKMRG